MRLILFDIDGTLVHSNRIGRAALGRALGDTFGAAGAFESISFNGMTDRGLVRELMRGEGWAEADIEARLPHFYERMAAAGQELFTPEHIRACPGVLPLLAALARRNSASALMAAIASYATICSPSPCRGPRRSWACASRRRMS